MESQSIRIGNVESPAVPVHFGARKGSVLGTVLFIVYTSTLPSSTIRDSVGIDLFSRKLQHLFALKSPLFEFILKFPRQYTALRLPFKIYRPGRTQLDL